MSIVGLFAKPSYSFSWTAVHGTCIQPWLMDANTLPSNSDIEPHPLDSKIGKAISICRISCVNSCISQHKCLSLQANSQCDDKS